MNYRKLTISLGLDFIHCFDCGEKGEAEPYLITYFFKMDGSCISVKRNADGRYYFEGKPKKYTPATFSGQGDLADNTGDVIRSGDHKDIPLSVGRLKDEVIPISVEGSNDQLPGLLGMIYFLEEEDAGKGNATDGLKIYDRLDHFIDRYLFNELYKIDSEKILFNQTKDVYSEIVKTLKYDAGDEPLHKIDTDYRKSLYFDDDDQIGVDIWLASLSDFEDSFHKPYYKRFHNEGDWEIQGNATGATECVAENINDILNSREKSGHNEIKSIDLDSARDFRDEIFNDFSQLEHWWHVVTRNNIAIINELETNPVLLELTNKFFQKIPYLLSHRDEKLDQETIECIERILAILVSAHDKRLRIDARRAVCALNGVRNFTVNQIVKVFSNNTSIKRFNFGKK